MTVFKKIIDKEIPADIVYEDSRCLAFRDINPKAKVHVLLVPKKEIPTLDDAEAEADLMGYLMTKVPHVARLLKLTDGYRVVIHCKEGGGQEVFHLHLHIMGNPVE